LRDFLATEISGGIVLLVATVAALAWANSSFAGSYERLWGTDLSLRLGDWRLAEDLRGWVNDGLMTLFFFAVGLEIKRELVKGELNEPRKAALPTLAAVGGMVVPALLYLLVNSGGANVRGWGIPMATDIAFALGVLSLVGRRAPSSLTVLLLTLAIVDDIGAILVIALFYSGGVEVLPLLTAAVIVVAILGLRAIRVWWLPIYVLLGSVFWLAVHGSGIHATIAGVILGLMTPVRPLDPTRIRRVPLFEDDDEEQAEALGPEAAHRVRVNVDASTSVAERLNQAVHPWASFVIVPLFALANAGVRVDADAVSEALGSRLVWGIVLGLVAGKVIGVAGSVWLTTRLGLASLPEGLSARHVGGLGAVAGIGFTIALFITGLAFESPGAQEQAKIGVLLASVLAAVLGWLILRTPRARDADA
jgi:NhaA family Na+:H+ antiporter